MEEEMINGKAAQRELSLRTKIDELQSKINCLEKQMEPFVGSFQKWWANRRNLVKYWDKKNDELKHMATWFSAACWGKKIAEDSYHKKLEELEKQNEYYKAEVNFYSKACSDQDDKIETLEKKNEGLKDLLKDICSEWDEACNKTCDSFAHDETCAAVNIAQAKRALQTRISALEACIAEKDKALQRGVK